MTVMLCFHSLLNQHWDTITCSRINGAECIYMPQSRRKWWGHRGRRGVQMGGRGRNTILNIYCASSRSYRRKCSRSDKSSQAKQHVLSGSTGTLVRPSFSCFWSLAHPPVFKPPMYMVNFHKRLVSSAAGNHLLYVILQI